MKYLKPTTNDKYALLAIEELDKAIDCLKHKNLNNINRILKSSLDYYHYFTSGNRYFEMIKQGKFFDDKQVLLQKFNNPDKVQVLYNEFQLVIHRITEKDSIQWSFYEHLHSICTLKWLYESYGIVPQDEIADLREYQLVYLRNTETFFHRDDESKYSGRMQNFIRNAYRAELYIHKITTPCLATGQYDMYTPLILTRMAVEQYLKFLFEKYFKGEETPSSPNECRKILAKNGKITPYFSYNLHTITVRGNMNTHTSYAGQPFAVIHGIEVLKLCIEDYKHRK